MMSQCDSTAVDSKISTEDYDINFGLKKRPGNMKKGRFEAQKMA